MNKIFLHLWLFTLGSSILHSCTQNEAVPDVESQDQENEITFQTNENASRAFIDGNLSTEGTTIQLYGYHDDSFLAANTNKILNGKSLTCQENGTWAVTNAGSPVTYFWEGEGNYQFFGYLTYDAASGQSIPSTLTDNFDNSEKKLTISGLIKNDYNQFDFLYSEIDARTMNSNNIDREKRRAVSMEMKHLLTAFSIGAENTTDESVTIKKVELRGLHDMGSAVIDYSGDAVNVNFTTSINGYTPNAETEKTQNTKPVFVNFQSEGGYELKSETKLDDIFSPTSSVANYYMIWPQAASAVAPSTRLDGVPNRRFAASDSLIYVEYTMGGKEYKRRMKFPSNLNWEAGKKYHFDILFADQLVQLNTTVKDWTYTSATVDFSENSVSVLEHQTINKGWNTEKSTINTAAKTVTVLNGQPIEGKFAISTPTGARWRVSMEGDINAFEISDDRYPYDDQEGLVGVESTIKLTPKITDPDRDYKVKLKFVVITADGKTIAIDSWLQDSDKNPSTNDVYQLILPH